MIARSGITLREGTGDDRDCRTQQDLVEEFEDFREHALGLDRGRPGEHDVSLQMRSDGLVLFAEDAEGGAQGIILAEVRGSVVQVQLLFVRQHLWRTGVGTEFMNRVINWAPATLSVVRLLVDANNSSAIRFYERMGFAEERRYPMGIILQRPLIWPEPVDGETS